MTETLIFLIKTVASIFCALLFIRAWLFYLKVPAFNDYSRFIYKLTDFAVKPTQKILPPGDKIDWASMILAFIVCVAMAFIVTTLWISSIEIPYKGHSSAMFIDIGHVLLFGLSYYLQNFLSIILWVGIVYAITSWLAPQSALMPLLRSMMEPMLIPIRNKLPESLKQSPVDLSLFVLLIVVLLLQVLVGNII
ncbi:conserved uncharacterized membrane protein [Taylorella asinigenitalis 14/45]|uniref:Conserved uncharacterized membrane protein n=1 Tax=Taylorella asinigenitalis 14/45 TaxID=1091495 RepID=I7IL56_9BURK|nr:YggT family protein [Taylorella asinigenitalis]CCG19798.1 conserved uncharacterized membrane protein [Taylorella asinigenitalis 14/45]